MESAFGSQDCFFFCMTTFRALRRDTTLEQAVNQGRVFREFTGPAIIGAGYAPYAIGGAVVAGPEVITAVGIRIGAMAPRATALLTELTAAEVGLTVGGTTALVKTAESLAVNSGPKLLSSPRRHLLDSVTDPKLRNRIDQLYRANAKVGSGSTADAIRHELKTGELLSPKGHFQKGIEMRNGLMKDIKSGRLNEVDTTIARRLVKDLQNALTGQ